ncbi:hypothetical protein QIS99_30395 [Streptomyces sp. B-S-A8]|uniref:Uncharacterized protein n=1 Tax=Streptomyces solicavernae TaxID=3043614 RepID=A0ABT6S1A3_9ACTN|nr:hypothetical protein [Streptomyces sp. B-S-A8]MDI3390471.1 hypothetical protein [Streptomyces sp. B-S-A8]
MTLSREALAVIVLIVMAVIFFRKQIFKSREFWLAALFLTIAITTPFGASLANSAGQLFYGTAETAGNTVNSVAR